MEGGGSDTDEVDPSIAATAQAQATAAALAQATVEALAQATAEALAQAAAESLAQATATATSLDALIGENEGARLYADAYEGLSASIRTRLDLAGITKAEFVGALSGLGPEGPTVEQIQAIIHLLQAIGGLEVTFLPTGNQVARLMEMVLQFAALEEGEEVPEPTAEEFLSFFDTLAADVRAELDANGWTPERLTDFIESNEDPSLEELESLLGPLADMSVPPLAPMMQAFLTQFPAFLIEPFIEQIGPEAYDELKSGARTPTGGESLAFFEVLMSMEDLGGEPPSPDPGEPDPEEIKSFFGGLPADVKAELEANGWPQERLDALIESDEEPPIEELRTLLGPLGDIPVTFATEQTAVLLDFILEEFPNEAAVLMAILGQQAFNELGARSRPPTGREYLALLEVLFALEDFGGLGDEPQPIPTPMP